MFNEKKETVIEADAGFGENLRKNKKKKKLINLTEVLEGVLYYNT